MGVSFKSTSLKFPLEPLDARRPAYGDVVSACAISMASLASVGKNNRANATTRIQKYTTAIIKHWSTKVLEFMIDAVKMGWEGKQT